ncbi:Aspartyl/Asparaginyl beta-hydroxylase-domain-containing protein [Ochromonadaceae sp. CCMP2298]|nr:Aspartyl/Asparaginyl beta-hydroxylase-domain-containing protein [Ochromonadaceae sp. CCMP2298]
MASSLATILQSAVLRTKVKHRPAPSLFYFPGLSTEPVFDPKRFPCAEQLRAAYPQVLQEYIQLRQKGAGSDYDTGMGKEEHKEHKLHAGQWDWNSYIIKGERQADFAVHCPQTVSLLESIDSPSALMRDTPFSFAFFSTLHPASSIAAHTGPCNLRIRCHLPLLVPKDAMQPAGGEEVGCGMEVGPVKVAWKEGEPVFFDDCFQHRVWNHTHSQRVLLLFDLWHPELHPDEVLAITEMFKEAREKGWLK